MEKDVKIFEIYIPIRALSFPGFLLNIIRPFDSIFFLGGGREIWAADLFDRTIEEEGILGILRAAFSPSHISSQHLGKSGATQQ